MGMIINPYAFGSGIAPDTYFKNVIFLSGFEGTNGSTSFVDESNRAATITANGNAQITTAAAKFGSSAYLGDGTGDYLTIPDSDDFYFGASNFTIEAWVRFASIPHNMHLWSQGTSPTALILNGPPNPALDFYISSSVSTASPTSTPTIGQWYHVVGERSGDTIRVYRDGAMLAKTIMTAGTLAANHTTTVRIGDYASGSNSLDGNLDDLRVTFGIARYDSDSGYTVPASAFPRTAAADPGTYRFYNFVTSGNNGGSGAVLAQEISVAESNGGANIARMCRVYGSAGFFSGAEEPNKAINGVTTDWWQPATGGNIVFDCFRKLDLHELIWTPHPSFLDRTPTSIEVRGTNDATLATYTTLHTFTGLTGWSGARTLQW